MSKRTKIAPTLQRRVPAADWPLDEARQTLRELRALLAVARAADSEAIWQGDDRDDPALHPGWRRLGKALRRLRRASSREGGGTP